MFYESFKLNKYYSSTAVASGPEWAATNSVCSSAPKTTIGAKSGFGAIKKLFRRGGAEAAVRTVYYDTEKGAKNLPAVLSHINKMRMQTKIVRIATWNIRSLFMTENLANVEADMSRLNINILRLNEVRWSENKSLVKEPFII